MCIWSSVGLTRVLAAEPSVSAPPALPNEGDASAIVCRALLFKRFRALLSPSKNAFFYSIFYFLFLFCTRCPRPRKLGSSFAHVEHPCSAGVKRNESSRRSGDFGKTSAPTDS